MMTSEFDNIPTSEMRFHQESDDNPIPKRFRRTAIWVSLTFAVLTCIFIITLFVLYGQVSQKPESNNYYTSSSVVVYDFNATYSTSSIPSGTAVSYNSDGAIQQGGGTTIYKNVFAIENSCSKYVRINQVFNGMYVTSEYITNKGTNFTVLQPGAGSNKAQIKYNVFTSQYNIYSLITLSATNGILLGITQDSSTASSIPYIVAISVNKLTYQLTFGEAYAYSTGKSYSPQITRMSEVSFAVTFYQTNSVQLATQHGIVDTSTASLPITLSPIAQYANNSKYQINTMDVVGLSSSTYLVTYYDTLDSAQAQSGPLFVIIATVVTSGLQSTVTLNSKTYEMKSSELIYYYETIRIDDNTAIIAYDDITTGNGITAQLLTVTSEYVYEPDVTYMYPADDAENGDYEQLVQFGATFKVTTGRTESNSARGYSELRLESYTADGTFALLFSDVGNNDALTLALLQVTASNGIARVTPNIVVKSYPRGAVHVNHAYQWGALATGRNESSNGQLAILSTLSAKSCTEEYPLTLDILESLPKPIGIMQQKTNSGVCQFAVAGIVSLSTGTQLYNGHTYFTTTTGQLVESDAYFGSSPLTDVSHEPNTSYVSPRLKPYVETNEVIVLMEGQIGVAVNSNSILISKF